MMVRSFEHITVPQTKQLHPVHCHKSPVQYLKNWINAQQGEKLAA